MPATKPVRDPFLLYRRSAGSPGGGRCPARFATEIAWSREVCEAPGVDGALDGVPDALAVMLARMREPLLKRLCSGRIVEAHGGLTPGAPPSGSAACHCLSRLCAPVSASRTRWSRGRERRAAKRACDAALTPEATR
jgi:hypothetical protein